MRLAADAPVLDGSAAASLCASAAAACVLTDAGGVVTWGATTPNMPHVGASPSRLPLGGAAVRAVA